MEIKDVPAVITRLLDVVPGGQAGLAKRLSTSDKTGRVAQPQISRWKSGGDKPDVDNFRKIEQLALELGVLPTDIRSEDVAHSGFMEDAPPRMLKIKGSVGAGGQALIYAEGQGDHGEIPATAADPPTAAAALIVGSSLGQFFDRWYAIYDTVRHPFTDDLIGELCIVGLKDGRILIKKIARKGGRLVLLSNDPNEAPIERDFEIEWAGRITDIRRA